MILVAGVANLAAAQVPEPPVAPAPPPDLVLSPGGGMIRGTILESVPGQYVVIALPSGETRRIDWAQVTYAGPAASAPQQVGVQATPSYGTGAGPSVTEPFTPTTGIRVRFESPQPGVSFHRVTGTASATAWGGGHAYAVRAYSFERLCTAPCELTLEPGSYQLALSVGSGTEVPAQVLDLTSSGTVTGEYIGREGLRIAGWLSIILGGLAGATMATVPVLTSNNIGSGHNDWIGWMIAGLSVAVVAEIVGMILAFQADGAVVRFD